MITYRLRLDVNAEGTENVISIRKGDSLSRKLVVMLTASGEIVAPAAGSIAVLQAERADGGLICADCTVDGNNITHIFTAAETSSAGSMRCVLTLYGADGAVLYTPSFTVEVEDNGSVEGEIGSGSLTALESAMTSAARFESCWSNPTVTAAEGDATSAKVTLTDGGVSFDFTLRPGKDGIPAQLGTEAGLLVETGESGILTASRRLLTGSGEPSGLDEGDIYLRTCESVPCVHAFLGLTVMEEEWLSAGDGLWRAEVPLEGADAGMVPLITQAMPVQGLVVMPALCRCGENVITLYASGSAAADVTLERVLLLEA